MPRYPVFKIDPDAPHPLLCPEVPPVPAPPPRIRAAEYVRMSTDFQLFSIANQRAAIAEYAEANGIDVVRTYADEGISGLSIKGRKGLQSLLNDIAIGKADFTVVLVFDVSRWGRFQDVDESAHYEFLCRAAGITVEYCAEPFRNDRTPMAAIMKGLKRVMAGEYSRELSEKVFAAKCRMIRMGYRQGGRPGYGLRRAVVDRAGNLRAVLKPGEYKFLQTDRIKVVAGPPEELAVVRWIFEQVAYVKSKPGVIVKELNRRGVPGPRGKARTQAAFRRAPCPSDRSTARRPLRAPGEQDGPGRPRCRAPKTDVVDGFERYTTRRGGDRVRVKPVPVPEEGVPRMEPRAARRTLGRRTGATRILGRGSRRRAWRTTTSC